MKLNTIFINGYRNIVDTKIELNDLTSILSLNNYGKSNLLTAIVFGVSFIQQHPKIKQNMMNDVTKVPFLKNNNSNIFTFKIECETEINNMHYYITYSYSFKWFSSNINDTSEIIKEDLKIRDSSSQTASAFIKRDENGSYYKRSETARCSTEILIDKNDLILNKLTAYDNLFYIELIKKLLNINVYVDRHFDSQSSYGITFMSEQELTDLTLKPALNIPKTLYNIKEKHPDKYNLLKNVFTSLFPNILDFQLNEVGQLFNSLKDKNNEKEIFSDKVYVLYVKDTSLKYSINFNAMSDGAKRILLLITFIIVAQINNYNLICIEEPENSIHPSLLKKLLNSLYQLSEETQLIFTSHSPYLINYLQIDDIYLGIPNNKGYAQFKKLKTNPNAKKRLLKNVENSDMQLGDYLFDLFSGNYDDIKELITYVE